MGWVKVSWGGRCGETGLVSGVSDVVGEGGGLGCGVGTGAVGGLDVESVP